MLSPHYNQNYTKKQVDAILQEIRECVINDNWTIAQNFNRAENIAFIQEYNITHEKQRRILLQIKVEDFCHSLRNTKPGYEKEILYVFCPQVTLYNVEDEEKNPDVYIKFNIIEFETGSRVVVISFHERNKPIIYLFR